MAISNYVSSKSGGSVQTSTGRGGQETKLASVSFVFTEPDDIVEKLTETDKIFEEIENVSDYFEKDGLYYGAIRYRTPEQAEKWVESNLGIQVNGSLDPKTQSFNWVVGEGYEEKKLMKGILKYGETEKKSKYYLHTKQPLMTSKSQPSKGSTSLKRQSMVDTIDFINYSLDKIFEYKKQNGCYPFEIVGFLPQDQKDGEDMTKLIPYNPKVVKLKKTA